MARDPINIGSAPDDGTGDYLRVAFGKTNNNFIEIYNSFIMTSKLTIGNSTVNTYLTNTGTVFLGSNTANLYANSSSVYVINSTANMVLLANGIQFYSNATNAAARITITDFYVGNTTSNVIITTTNNTLAFGGNNTTKSTFTANNSDIVIGNNTVVAAPQITLQNSSSKSVFGTRSVSIGNSTSAVVTSISIQNLSSTFLANSAAASFTFGSNTLYFDTSYQMFANSSANVKLTTEKISFNEDTTFVNSSGLFVNNSQTYVNSSSFYSTNVTSSVELSVVGLNFQSNNSAYIKIGNSSINTASNSSTLYFSSSHGNTVITSNSLTINSISSQTVLSSNLASNSVLNIIDTSGNVVFSNSSSFYVANSVANVTVTIGSVKVSNNSDGSNNVISPAGMVAGNTSSNVSLTFVSGLSFSNSLGNASLSAQSLIVANSTSNVSVSSIGLTAGNSTINASVTTSSLSIANTSGSATITAAGANVPFIGVNKAIPTTGAFVDIAAGNTTVAPLEFNSGTNLTTPIAGAMEYNGITMFATPVSSQRGVIQSPMYYMLNAQRTGPTNSSTFSMFGVGASLAVGRYLYEIYFPVTKNAPVASALQYAIATSTGTITSHGYDVVSYATATTGQSIVTTAYYVSNYLTSGFSTLTTVTNTSGVNAGTYNVMRIRGHLDISVAATGVNPQFAWTVGPTTSTIQAGAYIAIWPISAQGANTSVGNWT